MSGKSGSMLGSILDHFQEKVNEELSRPDPVMDHLRSFKPGQSADFMGKRVTVVAVRITSNLRANIHPRISLAWFGNSGELCEAFLSPQEAFILLRHH